MNGLDRAKDAKKNHTKKGEGVTWIVYNDSKAGYSKDKLDEYSKQASKLGITMKVVSSVDEIENYVNEKDGGDSREKDRISSFYYVGHSTPGDLDVGYEGSGENFEPDDFDADAFSSACHVNLVGGCRTAIPGYFEDSAVTQFAEILDQNSTVYGSNVRTFYPGGVAKDAELLKKNKGAIIVRKGELPVKKEKKP